MWRSDFAPAFALTLLTIAVSLIASISPLPNVGVGVRKLMLAVLPKSGCTMPHDPASGRPVMTNRSCTPPSGDPSGLFLKRTSRTGPLDLMNGGIALLGLAKLT